MPLRRIENGPHYTELKPHLISYTPFLGGKLPFVIGEDGTGRHSAYRPIAARVAPRRQRDRLQWKGVGAPRGGVLTR